MPLHPQARLQQALLIAPIVNAAFTMETAVGHGQGSVNHG